MSHLGQRLSALIDGELSAAERDRVLAHVARCEGCCQEAAALRALKQRMHSLGEAMVDTALTGRLMAMAASGEAQDTPGWRPRALYAAARWVAAGLVASAMAGVGTVAFFVGGEQQDPGPKVTPAVDTFLVQHGIVTGDVPVPPASAEPSSAALPKPDASSPGASSTGSSSTEPSSTGPSSTGLAGAGTAARRTSGAATPLSRAAARPAAQAGASAAPSVIHAPTTSGSPSGPRCCGRPAVARRPWSRQPPARGPDPAMFTRTSSVPDRETPDHDPLHLRIATAAVVLGLIASGVAVIWGDLATRGGVLVPRTAMGMATGQAEARGLPAGPAPPGPRCPRPRRPAPG